tara:strand:- start:472 stop:702 length:231 start_codon:yes stop_codon:yes gene_type:complete
MTWQNIKSAPKDKEILVVCKNAIGTVRYELVMFHTYSKYVREMSGTKDIGCWHDSSGRETTNIIGWMYLPEPPDTV